MDGAPLDPKLKAQDEVGKPPGNGKCSPGIPMGVTGRRRCSPKREGGQIGSWSPPATGFVELDRVRKPHNRFQILMPWLPNNSRESVGLQQRMPGSLGQASGAGSSLDDPWTLENDVGIWAQMLLVFSDQPTRRRDIEGSLGTSMPGRAWGEPHDRWWRQMCSVHPACWNHLRLHSWNHLIFCSFFQNMYHVHFKGAATLGFTLRASLHGLF